MSGYSGGMSHGKTIAKNAAWLMLATTGQKLIAFFVFTLVARWVGVETTGRYFFAVSITSMFVILTDLGLTPVVIRELAANEAHGLRVLRRALSIKAVLIPFAVIAAMAYAFLTQPRTEDLLAIFFACFVMSADAVSLIWYGAIRGMRKLKYEAFGMLCGQSLTGVMSLVLAGIFYGSVYSLIAALLLGSLWNVFWSILQARKLGIYLQNSEPWPWKALARAALPFALAGLFVKIYSYTDTLLLKQYHDAIAVGYYAIAYKVTYAFQFVPLAFVAALYPGLSAVHAQGDQEGLRRVLHGSLRLMIVVSAPLAAALSGFADRAIPLIYGQSYQGSTAPLQILAWVLIPIFLDFPIGSLLNATHRAEKKTLAMGMAMVVNVVANFLLIPAYGPSGAAWAGCASFFTLFFVGVWFARRDIRDAKWFALLCGKGVFCAAVLWWAIAGPLQNLSFFPSVLAAMALSLALLVGLRLVKREDARLAYAWIKERNI